MSSTLAVVNEVQLAVNVITDETGLITTGFCQLLGPFQLQSRGLDEAAKESGKRVKE